MSSCLKWTNLCHYLVAGRRDAIWLWHVRLFLNLWTYSKLGLELKKLLQNSVFIKTFETILDLVDKCNSFLNCKISLSNVTGTIISMFVLVRFVAVFQHSCRYCSCSGFAEIEHMGFQVGMCYYLCSPSSFISAAELMDLYTGQICPNPSVLFENKTKRLSNLAEARWDLTKMCL